jgi:glyoxylase-like metal-dependent hydrolase (beta-lactamase superfamily II)/rhodanese-related sulfurtransferase
MKRHSKRGSGAGRPLEIEPTRLKEKLDNGEDIFILDVRSLQEHDAWKLSYDKYQETPVIPMDMLASSQDLLAKQIPKNKEIVTLCAHGHRSQMAAQMLSKLGYNVKSIKGGMAAWNQVYDIAEVSLGIDSRTQGQKQLRIWQLRRVSKGCMGYVVASGASATVIDSTCALDNSVLELTEENGLKIVNVVDTHMHADHVSGLSTLAKRTGAKAFVSINEEYETSTDLEIQVNPLKDNQQIPLSDGLSLRAIHTPGHTEGSMTFVLTLGSATKQKNYLFTGDTLFVNAVGRPDLHNKAKEYATKLYNTYQTKVLNYPDDTVILPAHFDTNSISLKHGEIISELIGSVKKNIKLLSIQKSEFIDFMVSSVPPRPANYEKIIQLNKWLTPCDQVKIGDLEEGPNACAIKM